MRQNCKSRVIGLLSEIKGLQVNKKCPGSVLILDEITTPLLSSAVSEFMSLGVKDITKATLKKKPCPTYAGIYYISHLSLPLLTDDFKKEPIYHSINLILNSQINEDIMKTIAADKNITDRLAYFGQLRLNVKYLSDNLGLISKEDQLFRAFLTNQLTIPAQQISQKILEAIIGGFKEPSKLVVYHNSNGFVQEIVKQLGTQFKEYRKSVEESESKKQGSSLKVLLVDRTMDLASPLVSNFYYLNMISDIFRIDYDHNEVLLRNNSKIKLNFDDPIFKDYKHLHISKVQGKIEPDLTKFKAENKAAQMHTGASTLENNGISNTDMKNIISSIPEYNKKIKSYENNVNMSLEIIQISKEEKLPEIGQIQQLIVSGLDGRGEEIKDKRIIQRAQELCLKIKDPEKIVKIMLLMLMCLECSQSQRKLFINKIKEFHEFSSLGEMAQTQLQKLVQKPSKLKLNPSKQRVFLHMHQCLLESILVDLIEKKKNPLVSLSVMGSDQQKKVESKFETMTKKQNQDWLVIVLGGISLNQIVQLERVQKRYKGNQVSFISSEVLTTWSYLDRLGTLFEE